MKNVFTISLAIIGAIIGFILAMTIILSSKNDSPLMLGGVSGLFAIIGGYALAKMATHIDTLEESLQRVLTILCAVIAFILLLFFIMTVTMLKTMIFS